MGVVLDVDRVDDLARGCALLGSGGGGDVRVATHLLAATLATHGPIVADDPEDVSGGSVALVGAVGSPTVMTERLPGGAEFAAAVGRLEAVSGRRITHVAPLEIGGVNGLLGVVAALESGRALLDADGMGRAFPRLDQCVLTGRVSAVPLALVDPSGGSLVIEGVPAETLERTVRAVLPAMGTWAALACYLTDVSTLAAYAVPGSLGRALDLGSALARRELSAGLDVAAIGSVIDVLRAEEHRQHGIITLLAEDGAIVRLDHAEELVCVLRDGELLAEAPTIIAVVDARTWRPLLAADVRVGQRLAVLLVPAPLALADRAGTHGLTAYGLEVLR